MRSRLRPTVRGRLALLLAALVVATGLVLLPVTYFLVRANVMNTLARVLAAALRPAAPGRQRVMNRTGTQGSRQHTGQRARDVGPDEEVGHRQQHQSGRDHQSREQQRQPPADRRPQC